MPDLRSHKGHDFDDATARIIGICIEECMIEIKAKSIFDKADYVQALSYLKASGFRLGLLVNFGSEKLQVRRLVNSP